MRKVVLLVIALAGCGEIVEPYQWKAAEAACKPHGGIKWSMKFGLVFPEKYTVRCMDNKVISGDDAKP